MNLWASSTVCRDPGTVIDLSLVIVTDRLQARRPLLDVIKAALDGGARTVLLREKDLPRERRWVLASRLRMLGADVIVAGTDPLGGNAIHLAATDPRPTCRNCLALAGSGPGTCSNCQAVAGRAGLPAASRRPAAAAPGGHGVAELCNTGVALATPVLPSANTHMVGRSCHGLTEVSSLTVEDYCTLSPIFQTASKPGYGPALGPAVLGARDNIVALGGVDTPGRAAACRQAGALGVAVMGAVMRAADPASVVKGLLA